MKQTVLASIVAVAAATLASVAASFPGPTSCLLVGASKQFVLKGDALVDSTSPVDHQDYLQLIYEGRKRIDVTFGKVEANPIVVFLGESNRIGPFKLNSYGSTHLVGSRACVVIGTDGRSVDVVAHELMHAEVSHRMGYLAYVLDVPSWFDEGVAMQVDYRTRYSLSAQEATGAHHVRALTAASTFFVDDDEALTRNYSYAKYEVSKWLSRIGSANLYSRLARIRSGSSFEEVLAQ
jgi:hypothetical protein